MTSPNQLDTLHAIAHDRLPAMHYPPGTVEWDLARVLEKSLEKEPDERYQTMKDLGIDLRRQRQLDEDAVDPRIGVERCDAVEVPRLPECCRQGDELGGDPDGLARLDLVADVDLGGGIVTDQDGGEPGRPLAGGASAGG